jgi:hypothetical protein
LTSDAGSQNSGPAGNSQGGDPEAARIQTLDQRFGAIEAEQKEQRGLLTEIRGLLGGSPKAPSGGPGGSGGPHSGSSPDPSSSPASPSVAEQVRQGVKEIEAEKEREAKAKAAADADSAWRATVEQALAERRPAEPGTGFRARLQRGLVGKPDPK